MLIYRAKRKRTKDWHTRAGQVFYRVVPMFLPPQILSVEWWAQAFDLVTLKERETAAPTVGTSPGAISAMSPENNGLLVEIVNIVYVSSPCLACLSVSLSICVCVFSVWLLFVSVCQGSEQIQGGSQPAEWRSGYQGEDSGQRPPSCEYISLCITPNLLSFVPVFLHWTFKNSFCIYPN